MQLLSEWSNRGAGSKQPKKEGKKQKPKEKEEEKEEEEEEKEKEKDDDEEEEEEEEGGEDEILGKQGASVDEADNDDGDDEDGEEGAKLPKPKNSMADGEIRYVESMSGGSTRTWPPAILFLLPLLFCSSSAYGPLTACAGWPGKYQIKKCAGEVYYCLCPAWKNQNQPVDR
jgi:hypothetical protein